MKRVGILSRYQNTTSRGVESFVKELKNQLADEYEVEILSGEDSDSFSKIINGKYDYVFAMNGWSQSLKAAIGRIFGGYKLIITGQNGLGKGDIFNVLCRPDVFVGLTNFAIDLTTEEEELTLISKLQAKLRKAKTWSLGNKIVKIPNGVDLSKFKPKGEKFNHGLKSPVVLSVGALTWYKGHEKTIKAIEKLPEFSLLIVGSGEDKEKLEILAKEKLGPDRFKIISAKYEDLPSIYRSADIFTLPSWSREAFGIVYLEAMASNLPIVAPDDSPRREIVGDAGILVDVTDAEKYAQVISEAYKKKWGDIPRIQAEKFSWEKIGEEYKKLLRSL